MARNSIGQSLTRDEVHERLAAMLRERYANRIELMALDLDINRYYLGMLLKQQRRVPRWLLERLGVSAHRQTVIEYFVTN